ncbi:MAG: sugar transferase [Clostridia bacterium]|nr:sugar transferase [Clostridia bacterium]
MNINDTTVCINRTVNVNMKAKSISKIMKRIIDILAGIVGMIILIPLMLIIKIANIFTKDSASIFFIQNRIGKDGKIFKMYKFRTMIVGAEEELEKLLIENEEIRNEYELNKKIKDDPRVTKIGKFLRKTSLDEFPQFINILKGEMSLVGPRPYLKREKKDIGQDYYKIIEMTPGLTGLWQVSGRSNITFEERVKLDIEYYKKNSFFGDMKILLKTITAVLNKKGAV